ncbi:MAG TPA: polysaccharide biosynthesis/export family protein [Gemmataceae bacterium]|nr:polysaccharide biosynthesis/export family protein [Gemmataceae bacterium]
MKAGKGWSTGEARSRIENRESRLDQSSIFDPLSSIFHPLCALLLLAGCVSNSAQLDKKLMADKPPVNQQGPGLGDSYLVGFPDVLEIQVNGHPESSGECVIGPDGRIDLGPSGSRDQHNRLRVEGKSPAEVAGIIANHAGLPVESIQVRVKEYRSQQLFLIGQVVGWQRTVSYHGPETVLEVLQRVGGITPGAAPDEIFVVRAHVAEGPRPEVFHVDLNAILQEKDQKTNIRLLPFDQVYVGESKKAKLLKCIPPCLRPVFFPVLGIRPIGPEGNGLRPRGNNARSENTARN